jgi:P27 family predicted phage terminase small subunit
MPKPPEWLEGEGLKEWFRWVKLLFDQGTLNLIDANVLGYYCDAHADFLFAKELCKTKGGKTSMVIKTTNGNLVTSPAYAIKRHARAEAARLAAELGMSPTGRTEINVPKSTTPKQSKAQKWVAKNGA